MLGKFNADWSFFLPLLAHAGVHAVMTLVIALAFRPELWWLALVDLVVHFIVDRIKAGPKYLGRYHDKTKAPYWMCLGADQMAHHLCHYWFIWMMVS